MNLLTCAGSSTNTKINEKVKKIWVTCHMSGVTCHVSHFMCTCLVSCVTCHMSHVTCNLPLKPTPTGTATLTPPLCTVGWFAKTLKPPKISKHTKILKKKNQNMSRIMLILSIALWPKVLIPLGSRFSEMIQKKQTTCGHCNIKTKWAQIFRYRNAVLKLLKLDGLSHVDNRPFVYGIFLFMGKPFNLHNPYIYSDSGLIKKKVWTPYERILRQSTDPITG